MKRLFALAILFVCSFASAQGKYRSGQYPVSQNPADYTIKVHISATHFRDHAVLAVNTRCGEGPYVDATVNGKKFEMFGCVDERQASQIFPGDYLGMMQKKPRYGGNMVVGQGYYLLLQDRSAWICSITGLSE